MKIVYKRIAEEIRLKQKAYFVSFFATLLFLIAIRKCLIRNIIKTCVRSQHVSFHILNIR